MGNARNILLGTKKKFIQRPEDVPPTECNSMWSAWRNSDGEYHRDHDLPALINTTGKQSWFQFGELHRDGDQPAVIEAFGEKRWYQHGLLHRDNDLPAREGLGIKEYWQHGAKHRENGPAVVSSVREEYWIRGVRQEAR